MGEEGWRGRGMGRGDGGGFRFRRDYKYTRSTVVCRKVGAVLKKKKKWKNYEIHVNSNGMCGVCLGEIYNLILDALCEHSGGGGGAGQ